MMKILRRNRTTGYTVIELMIVLIIIALLVALAYPSYIDYVRKSRRGEAQQLLLNWAINQEIYRSNNPEYADSGELAVPTHDHYVFTTVGTPNATTYALQAAAQDDQANDETRAGVSCATLTLNQAGTKGSDATCWN